MELKQLYTWMSLLLGIVICKLSECSAKATYYDLDSYENSYERSYDHKKYDSHNSYALTYGKPLSAEYLDKLNTGYYYVDNGYIAPVPSSNAGASQRSYGSYFNDDLSDSYRFSPIVRYGRTRAKRKKLFVPNFFG
ncbi:uncharacterized protein LOC6561039 [Drosophila grimshawi]|uniref:GH20016 n=1 Tax=Drosophila grimshawi TaxID=7222 RepID=B4J7Z8_DROGR|nr:uncharacterized protein LOC6561039 [Drosophila grimshawi]EDW02228.1 GH20016 [Drosophila grimshawi]